MTCFSVDLGAVYVPMFIRISENPSLFIHIKKGKYE